MVKMIETSLDIYSSTNKRK